MWVRKNYEKNVWIQPFWAQNLKRALLKHWKCVPNIKWRPVTYFHSAGRDFGCAEHWLELLLVFVLLRKCLCCWGFMTALVLMRPLTSNSASFCTNTFSRFSCFLLCLWVPTSNKISYWSHDVNVVRALWIFSHCPASFSGKVTQNHKKQIPWKHGRPSGHDFFVSSGPMLSKSGGLSKLIVKKYLQNALQLPQHWQQTLQILVSLRVRQRTPKQIVITMFKAPQRSTVIQICSLFLLIRAVQKLIYLHAVLARSVQENPKRNCQKSNFKFWFWDIILPQWRKLMFPERRMPSLNSPRSWLCKSIGCTWRNWSDCWKSCQNQSRCNSDTALPVVPFV